MNEETIQSEGGLAVIVGVGTANTADGYLIQRQAPENLASYIVADLITRTLSTAEGDQERLVAENVRLVLKERKGFLGGRASYSIEINGAPARASHTMGRYLDNLPVATKEGGEGTASYRQLNLRVAPTSRGGYYF